MKNSQCIVVDVAVDEPGRDCVYSESTEMDLYKKASKKIKKKETKKFGAKSAKVSSKKDFEPCSCPCYEYESLPCTHDIRLHYSPSPKNNKQYCKSGVGRRYITCCGIPCKRKMPQKPKKQYTSLKPKIRSPESIEALEKALKERKLRLQAKHNKKSIIKGWLVKKKHLSSKSPPTPPTPPPPPSPPRLNRKCKNRFYRLKMDKLRKEYEMNLKKQENSRTQSLQIDENKLNSAKKSEGENKMGSQKRATIICKNPRAEARANSVRKTDELLKDKRLSLNPIVKDVVIEKCNEGVQNSPKMPLKCIDTDKKSKETVKENNEAKTTGTVNAVSKTTEGSKMWLC